MAFTPSKSGSENDNSVVQSGVGSLSSGFAGKRLADSDKGVKHAADPRGKLGEMQAGGQKAVNPNEKLSDQPLTKSNARNAKRKSDDDGSDQRDSFGDVLADQTDGDAQHAESHEPMLLAAADTGVAVEASPVGGAQSQSVSTAVADSSAGAAGTAAAAGTAGGISMGAIIGTAAVVGIAAASGGGGGAAAAATGFTLSGTIALGKINDATGLVVEAFKADGTQLAGTGTVDANGTFTITVTENYTGPVLIRLKDTGAGNNYINEGTGVAADLNADLRAVVNVSGNGTITVAITPLTELAVRELVGDSGGDLGSASTTLGASVTTAQVTAANDNVKTAFGLTGDITTTIPVTVDDSTGFNAGTTAQKAYGQALAAIAGAEVAQGLSTGAVLTGLSQDLVGSTLSVSAIDELLAGAAVADSVGTNVTGTATALDTVIGSNISAVHISADTGSTDFITQTAAQTITATLDSALTGTKLWGSVDGGTTWTDISSFVTGASLSWTGVTLGNGDNLIKFAVTADTVTVFTGATADVVGKVSAQGYAVDTANPVFSSAATASFAENGTGTVYDATATDAHLLTYSIGGADAALFNIDPISGVVTFVSAPDREAPADINGDNVYDIAVTATDGAGNAATQSVAITVTNVNEAPTLPGSATASFAENATGTIYTATAADPDANTTLTYALGGTDAALFDISSSTGSISFKTAPNFEAPADAGANNVYDVTVTASDGALTTSAQAVTITVTNVNEAPTLTSGATANFAENGTGTAYATVATDQDAGTTLAYALAGTDAALFNIDSGTGAVTFKAVPNYEAPTDANADKVYDITVTASDGTNTTSAQAVAITVTNVNEAPTSTAITAATAVVNQAYSFNVSGNFADVDASDTLSYSATGLPSGLTINSTSGVISGTATTEALTNSITVTATDGGGQAASQTFNLPVVSAPVITGITANVAQAMSGDALTFTATVTEAVTITGTPTLSFDVGGQSMTATYSSGTGTNTLIFTATALAGDDASVTLSAIGLGGGAVTGNLSGQALVTTAVGQTVTSFVMDNTAPAFTSPTTASYAENGTAAAYTSVVSDLTAVSYTLGGTDAALFNLSGTGVVTFKTSPNFEAPADAGADNEYNVSLTATDALAHATTQSVAISVANVNETPTLTSSNSASFNENGTGTVHTVTATDPDASTTLTYALGGTDAALFAINASTGAVTFVTAPNFEAPADAGANNVYDVTVTAADGTNTTSAQAVTITVTNVNEAPTLTSGLTASVAENTLTSTAAYTATATDPEGVTLAYALGGTDAALFNIDPGTGAVTFKAAPNYEAPTDANADKVYDITVTASDGTNTTSAQAVAITVTNVNEAPVSTPSTSSVTLVVNQPLSDNMADLFSDVDAGDTLTFTATGLPTEITLATNGNLSGTPTTTGSATVVFTATDSSGLTATHTATVSIVSAPALTSTIDNVTNFEVTSNLVLTATENVTAVAGKFIHIINDGGTGFHGEATVNTQDIAVTDATKVTITNNTITINPGFDLDFANDYHIMVDAGAFLGVSSGQGSVATADATAMNFSTVNPSATATAAASQAMTSGSDALVSGHGWWDAEGNGVPGGASVARDFSGGNFAITANDLATNGIATNDFYIAVNNFAAGDLIYVDNHGANAVQRQGDFNSGLIVDLGSAPTAVITNAIGTTTAGLNGGQFDVTVAGSTASFTDTAALQVLLGNVTYQPILYG